MRKICLFILWSVVFSLMPSCDYISSRLKDGGILVTGKVGEILVVCEQDIWDSEIKKLLDSNLTQFIMPYYPDVATFELLHKTPDHFEKGSKRYRNTLFLTLDPSFKTSKLDVNPDVWLWKNEKDVLPIIMPRDFLVMLNTFMSASGIALVSEDLARDLNFKFTLQGKGDKDWFDARIVGFSNEIPSLLVPESFMNYGKNRFGDSTKQLITQIMLTGNEGEFGKVEEFLEKRGLESRKSQVVIGKLKSTISVLFMVVLFISLIAVFFSGLIFIQYLQLLIANNKYEIRTLLRLGYHPKKIITNFIKHISFVFGLITLLAIVLFLLLKLYVDTLFYSGGIFIDDKITWLSIFSAFSAFFVFVLLSYKSAKSKIIKEY